MNHPETEGLANDFLNRTTRLLGPDAIAELGKKVVAIAGCGGVGGAAAILLTRMGVGGLALADPGLFDPPDLNRQWAAATSTLGENKAATYARIVRDINPRVNVTTFPEGITDATLATVVDTADAVVDCLDLKVPLPLRLRMYQQAQRHGVYCVSAPIIGTGTLLMMADPRGMPLDGLIQGIVENALRTSRLPSGFGAYFFPDHVAALEASIASGAVPSLAVAPALAGAYVCVELLTVLLRAVRPRWRKPICLPDVLVVDALQSSCQVVDYGKVFPELAHLTPAATGGRDEHERRRLLRQVGFNTVALAHEACAVDLLSDSWSGSREAQVASATGAAELETTLRDFFPYDHVEPVWRGRYAEAILAQALIRPGGRVLSNGLFPTTRHHLGSRGVEVVELGCCPPGQSRWAGDLDLVQLEHELARGDVQAVVVELCNNARAGAPVSLGCLREVHARARARGVLVVLDGTRAFTNAAQLEAADPSAARGLAEVVSELCRCSDACVASLTKDFVAPVGGLLAVNGAEAAARVRQMARLYFGVPLAPSDREMLRRALLQDGREQAVHDRVASTRKLTEALRALGVPVVDHGGSHAVFVDAAAFLPQLPAHQHPAQALAAELYAVSGIRGACNLGTPAQQDRGSALLRLAVRVRDPDVGVQLIPAFERLMRERARIPGLRLVGNAPGEPERYDLAAPALRKQTSSVGMAGE